MTADGRTLYVAAFGSSKVGVFDTASLENDTRQKLRKQLREGALDDREIEFDVAMNVGVEIMSPLAFPSYDFEMNFAARKLNILSSDHCEGKVIYWQSQALAAVPIKIRDFHVEVPVKLDGKDFTAIID